MSRIAFTKGQRHIVLSQGKGHITTLGRDNTLHFTYNDEGVILEEGPAYSRAIRELISSAVRRLEKTNQTKAKIENQDYEE